MVLASINWNVDPEIFRIGRFAIRYYGLLWALSFYLGYLIFERIVKREGLPEGFLDSLTMYTAAGAILGARLGHCLFYEPAYYLSNPIEILKIWQGGLASHGAAIGIITALYLFSRKHKVSLLYVLDRIVITVALAGFLIRIGNLMNSEIYGHATTLPWGFLFPNSVDVLNGSEALEPRHPTQLYEAFAYIIFFLILGYIYIKKESKPNKGLLFGLFLVLIFAARFFIEFVKQPQVDFEKTMSLNMGQLLSLPFIITGVTFIVLSFYRKEEVSKKK